MEYAVSRFAGKAEVDLINLSGLKASAVAAHEGFKVRERRPYRGGWWSEGRVSDLGLGVCVLCTAGGR